MTQPSTLTALALQSLSSASLYAQHGPTGQTPQTSQPAPTDQGANHQAEKPSTTDQISVIALQHGPPVTVTGTFFVRF